jgi:hypothetical protein
MPSPASPLRCAERLRAQPLVAGAELVCGLEVRFARLVLVAFHRLFADAPLSPGTRAHADLVELLLQIRIGIYDHALTIGGRSFAVAEEHRRAPSSSYAPARSSFARAVDDRTGAGPRARGRPRSERAGHPRWAPPGRRAAHFAPALKGR